MFPIRKHGGFGQFAQLPAIDERLQDILLDVVIVVDDRGHLLAQLREILNSFFAAVIINIVGSRLGPQQDVIADVLFDEAIAVMTADDGVGQIHILDDGLQFSPVLFGDLPAEDHGDLVGLTAGPIRIQ